MSEIGWNRQQMADRLAREFVEGWIVNLGVGIPTLCSNADIGGRQITYHAENGVIGYGPVLPAGEEDLHLVNAGGQNVSLQPGAAIVHHADSFGIIRSGRIDVTVMGAYEVSAGGDFANWKVGGAKGGGIGSYWRHRRCHGSSRLRQARLHHPRAHHPQGRAAAGAALRAAGDGARRGDADCHQSRRLCADGGGFRGARIGAWRYPR